jgi:hypothetical protein
MQINSANSYTPNSALNIGGEKQTQVNETRERLVVQQEQEKPRQNSSQKNTQNNQVERLDVEPSAIALVEQNQQLNAEANVQQQSQATYSKSSGYDQPSQQNKTAVSTYQSVDGIAQRDSIQQAFGVDLYA